MARTRPRSRFRLFLEQLEDRTVPSGLMPLPDGGLNGPSLGGGSDGGGGVITPPNSTQAIFGTPWLDGTRLSLSFAADGTSVDNQASALFSSLGALPTSVCQPEILPAF